MLTTGFKDREELGRERGRGRATGGEQGDVARKGTWTSKGAYSWLLATAVPASRT